MSASGNFTTEAIWCERCHAKIGQTLDNCLVETGSNCRAQRFLTPEGAFRCGWWFGLLTGTSLGQVLPVFEDEIVPFLQQKLCHPVQLMVCDATGRSAVFAITACALVPARSQ